MITHTVAPTGTATDRDYRSVSFWDGVRAELQSGDDVTVVFRAGEYAEPVPVQGSRTRLGHPDRLLTLVSERRGAAVFTIVADAVDQSGVPCEHRDRAPKRPFYLRNAENVVLSGMTFTGPGTIGYVVRVEGGSSNVTIRECAFRDLPGVVFGATGATHPSTRNVVVDRCSFRNVGCDSHAHMYNDHGAHHITVRGCRFEECAGDYVRFRDRVDHCVVDGCTFIHRGDLYSG